MAEFDLSPPSPNPAPSVNLNVGGGGQLAGGLDPEIGLKGAVNPMAQIGQWVDIQNAMNQNKLFQQTMQARQGIGQILANTPDEATALKAVGSSPYAAYLPDVYNSLRQANLANVTAQHETQGMANEAMGQFYKTAPGPMLADPSSFDTLAKQTLATTPPLARQNVSDALGSVKDFLYGGIPANTPPDQVIRIVKQKMVGLAYGAGMTPDAVQGALGVSNIEVNRGGSTAFGQRLGPALGGGVSMNGGEVSNIPAPVVGTAPIGPGGATTPYMQSGSNVTLGTIAGGTNSAAPPTASTNLNPMAPPQSSASAPTQAAMDKFVKDHGGWEGAIKASPNDTWAMALGDYHQEMVQNQNHPAAGPSMTTQAYMQKVGGNMGDFEGDLNQSVQALIPLTLRMNVERQVLSGTPDNPGAAIGGWGEERAKLAQFLQGAQHAGIPIPDNWVQTVGNKSLSNSQVFKALSASQSAAQYQQAVEGTGRGFKVEYDAFKAAYPNLSTDPDATNKIYNFISATSKKYYQMQQDLMQFKHGISNGTMPGYTIDDFPAWEDKKMFQGGAAFNPPAAGQQSGAKPSNSLSPAAAGNQFKSSGDVKAAYHSGQIDRATATRILQSQFGYH